MARSLPLAVLTRSKTMVRRPSYEHLAVPQLFALVLLLGASISADGQNPPPASPTTSISQTQQSPNPLTIDDALRLANVQASIYQTAILNERIAEEDVKQAPAAHAGTEVAKRALAQAVIETYYSLALAAAQRVAAAGNLTAAEEFERITALLLSGGEVAPVDLTRAQLQTLARRDEIEKARVNEEVAAGSLRVLVGYEFSGPIAATDLALALPNDSEYQQFRAEDVGRRPEFIQLEQQLRAAQNEIRIARADRLPSLSYSINGGFDADSLKGPRLKEHTGVSAAVSLSIPIFDWGIS